MSGKQASPPVSVVMPVHNALPHLDDAVRSILEQSRSDFEFIIYDDASTDGSYERLQEWAGKDHRIKLVRGKRNLGPGASSNEVVRHASAPLIARMDADDISMPDRLQSQVDAFAAHPDAGIVASLCETMDPAGKVVRGPEYWRLTRKSWFIPFPHGSIMIRRKLFDALGGYRDECEFWEDLDLVLRASRETRIFVIPRALYRYRQSEGGTRLASKQERVEAAMDLRYRAIDRIRQGRDYKDLFTTRAKQGDRVDPRVSVSLGLLSVWSGHRTKLLRRFLERSSLGLNKKTILSAAAVTWMSISPATLRAFVNGRSALRNALVTPKPSPNEPVEWRPPPIA